AQVVQRFAYGPYGELLSGDATLTPFLFNGMFGVMSEGNGLYFMRARFYSPQVKRFVNQDPLVGTIVQGQSLNRFAFVSGRPVSFVDPFGLAQEHLDRAVDIVKTFLPHIYNAQRPPPIMKFIPPNELGSQGAYTDEFGYITVQAKFYAGPIPRNPKTGEYHNSSKAILRDLLETVIHEYHHSTDRLYYSNYFLNIIYNITQIGGAYFGPHAKIYETSKVLAETLDSYMFMTDEEWECTKYWMKTSKN
ncbi:MAG: RHS repeat-associated core domain-containing protein, partial [Pseudomonadota bacterium]|nr:RHS repeat-associated core domain-containing protein [Pseudomonadota bacterium]